MTASDPPPGEDNRRVAAVAAALIAVMPVYFIAPRIVGIALGASDPTGADLDTQIAMILDYPAVYASFGLLSWMVGAAFVALALAFHGQLRSTPPLRLRLITTLGLAGGGMYFFAGFGPVVTANWLVDIDPQNHTAAVALYVVGQRIVDQLMVAGSGLLALFMALVAYAAARATLVPRGLGHLGVATTVVWLVSFAVPAVLMGQILFMMAWSAWLGVALVLGLRRSARVVRG